MEKCIKCGGTLPAGAKVCPYCGNPVSLYEEKMQPVQPASRKQARWRTILILAVVVLSGLLISSLVFGIMLWTAPPKLVVSSGSLDYGTLQVGSQGSQVLTLSNSGRQDLNWRADKGKADWLTLDPSQGSIPSGGSQTINVRADTTLLTAGRYSASISFTSNGGEASVSAVLIVASGPVSGTVVSSISPTSGPASGGTTVTIIGSGFTGASKVLFGTVAASSFTVNSDTQITAVSPAGSGTVHVTVTTPGGTTTINNADQFTYVPAPTLASISPTSGPATGGTTVTIIGSGFTGASKVLFGTTAANFTVNSDTQITAVSPAGSGTVHVTVITPGGTSATSNADQFTYRVAPPIPTLASISPTSGPVAGGTSVIIRGSGFTGASKVLFGTVAASRFTVNSDAQITAVSPAGSRTVHVTVITPGGTSATSNADRFTYVPAPTLTSISPTSGPVAGGTSVIIRGSGFTGASKVLFGTVAASRFTVNSDTQITAVSPAGSGTVDVKVTTPGGTSATSNVDQFTYRVAPTLTSISPTSGPVAGGTTVTIKGSGFTGASKVLFGTVAANFTVNSDTQITAVSPAGSGMVHVTVITPGGTSATSNADQFTYRVAPTLASISPTSGPATGGTTVTIKGSGFTGASQVRFGTVAASNFTVNSDAQITAVSPAGSGMVHVTVTTPGGTSATSNADRFTYVPAPTIASISPTSGPVAGGTTVTITGSGFTGASKVLFGTVAANFMVNSDTQITAYSPGGSGTVHVTVTTPEGTSATSNADRFTYVPVPTLASISPTSGPVAGGTRVTITGSGFTEASQVLFGSTASIFMVNSDTQITVISPAGSGTVDVKVTTPGGTSATSNADQFTYRVAPTVTSISPTSGPAAGGTFVTITGSGFTGASPVRFGAVDASNFTVVSDTQITAVSPAGSGTVDVKVTTPGGTSATSNADRFTYVPAPAITKISPITGPVAGGTTVTITGSGFTGASQVMFGSTAASFTVNSDTQITAVSPAGSGTVDVKVTTPGGTSATSNADLFQYT